MIEVTLHTFFFFFFFFKYHQRIEDQGRHYVGLDLGPNEIRQKTPNDFPFILIFFLFYMYIFNSSLQILLEFGPKMFLTDQRCFSRICFALSQLGFNIPPGFNIPLGFNIPVGSQVYRKIPVEIPLGFNIPAGSHQDLVSQWDPGGIPSGSQLYFHLGGLLKFQIFFWDA